MTRAGLVSAEVKCPDTSAIFITKNILLILRRKCFYIFFFLWLDRRRRGVCWGMLGRDVVSRCDRGQVGLTWPMFQYSRSNSSNMTTFLLPSSQPAQPVYLLCLSLCPATREQQPQMSTEGFKLELSSSGPGHVIVQVKCQ